MLVTGLRLVVIFGFVISGCASIVDGRRQALTFNSIPEGAHVVVNGITSGMTPANVVLERSVFSDTVVVIKKEGYQDMEIKLAKCTNWWFLGNILTGGLIGTTTDTVSGAIVQYQPDQYQVTLTPLKVSQEQLDQLRHEIGIRNFILYMYRNLGEDIARGNGEALSSLYVLLGVSGNTEKDLAFAKIHECWVTQKEPPSFAEGILGAFIKKHVSVGA